MMLTPHQSICVFASLKALNLSPCPFAIFRSTMVPAVQFCVLLLALAAGSARSEMCGLKPTPSCGGGGGAAASHDYSAVMRSATAGLDFDNLPGYTRSAHYADHALIGVENRVFAGQRGWAGSTTAHIVSPARGANFAMYLAEMGEGSSAAPAAAGIERFVMVLTGEAEVRKAGKAPIALGVNSYAYFPPNSTDSLASEDGAGVLVYERVYAAGGSPVFHTGGVEESPLLPTGPEVFKLRKLLPQTFDYDFNVHIMDFQPGERRGSMQKQSAQCLNPV